MVSVIIPTYNREKVLARAIDSVLQQTYADLEVIIADDCSTDNTKALVESYTDSRVRYACLDRNSGACAARNLGIELAQGKYIAFQDSDDYWHPDKLEVQLAAMEASGADLTFCAFEKHYDNGQRVCHPQGMTSHICTREEMILDSLASTQCILGNASVIRDVMFDVTMPRLQDYDFMIRASGKYSIYYTDRILVTVFEQADSITAGKRSYRKRLDVTQKLLKKYADLMPLYPQWELRLLKTVIHSQVMLKEDALPTLKEVWCKEKNLSNRLKIFLYRIGLLYHIWDRSDR